MENPSDSEEAGPELFFELASLDRKRILSDLQKENLRLKEMAGRLGMTATEALRQLQRLTEASLIQKRPEGSYSITEYGKLILHLSGSLEFVSKHRDYFLTHDVQCLPREFVDRIGVLAKADMTLEGTKSMNAVGTTVEEAKEFLWGAGMESPLKIGPPVSQKASEGVVFRFILPQRLLPPQAFERVPGVEWRALDGIPVNMVLNEKAGGITFCMLGGKADYVGFGSSDPAFYGWLKDLFLYYWDRGKRNPTPGPVP